MEASIREPHIKDFVKLLQCASKFGDDLNMHATKDQWELAVTNSSRSAFYLFKLKRSFFCRYKAHGDTEVQKRRGVKCLLLVKSVLAVLGKATTMNNVERLDLTIIDPEQSLRPKRNNRQSSGLTNQDEQDEADYQEIMGDDVNSGIEAKLIMKLVCKHGVTKKHSLHLASSEFLRAEVDPNSTPSSFTVSARALRDMLDHFSIATGSASGGGERNGIRTENQLGWMFAKREVRVKTYEAGAGVGGLSTEIKVDNGEFDEYWVEGERVDLTLPMKEFRAALTLAEQLSISLTIAFSEATQPLTLTSDVEESKDWDFDIFCAIATTDFAGFSDVVPTGQPPSGRSGNGGGGGRSGRGSVPPSKQENDDDNGDAQDDRGSRSGTARSRAESQGPGKRKRPSLNLSANTSSRSTSIINRSGQGPRNSAVGSQPGQNGQEPLFLSNSQGPSQRVLSQQELLELTGFGEMSELEDALDDEDEADELEARRLAAETESGGGRPDRDDGIMQDSFNLPEGNGSLFEGGGDDHGQNGGGFSKVEETIEEDQRAEEEPAEGIDEEMDEDELDDTQPDKEFPSFFPDEDDMVSTRSKRSKPSDDPSGRRGR